jgi:hypothetical protein
MCCRWRLIVIVCGGVCACFVGMSVSVGCLSPVEGRCWCHRGPVSVDFSNQRDRKNLRVSSIFGVWTPDFLWSCRPMQTFAVRSRLPRTLPRGATRRHLHYHPLSAASVVIKLRLSSKSPRTIRHEKKIEDGVQRFRTVWFFLTTKERCFATVDIRQCNWVSQ